MNHEFLLLQFPKCPAEVSHVTHQHHWAADAPALLPPALPQQHKNAVSTSELHYPAGCSKWFGGQAPRSVSGHDVHLSGGWHVQLLHIRYHAQLHSLQETGRVPRSVPPVHSPRLDRGDGSIQGCRPGSAPGGWGRWGQKQRAGHLQPWSSCRTRLRPSASSAFPRLLKTM